MDLFAAKKIFVRYVAYGFDSCPAINQFTQPRQNFVFYTGLSAYIIKALHLCAGEGGDRNEELFSMDSNTVFIEVIDETENWDVVDL